MKQIGRWIVALLIAVSLFVGLSACTDKVEVSFDNESVTIKEGFTHKESLNLKGVEFDDENLKVESSNTNIFTVTIIDGFVEIKTLAVGTATLTIYYKNKSVATLEVKVIQKTVAQEALSINQDSITIEAEQTKDVAITLTGIEHTDSNLTVTSSNNDVATATIKAGAITITAVAEGTATITLKKGNLQDTIVVTVTAKEVEIPENQTLVTFIVEVPIGTVNNVNVFASTSEDFEDMFQILLTLNESTQKYEGSKLIEVGTVLKYKYVNGNSWDYVEKGAGGEELENRTVTIAKNMAPLNDTVLMWAGSVIPPQKVMVSFVVTVPAVTGEREVYLISNLDDWQEANAHLLTKDATTGKYELELELEVGSTFKYKYVLNKLWANVEVQANGLDLADNRELIVAADQAPVADTVERWKNIDSETPSEKVAVSFVVTVPAETGDSEVYLISNLDDWQEANAHLLTKDATTGNYKLELELEVGSTFEYKYVLNKLWVNVEVQANGDDLAGNRKLTVAADQAPVADTVARWKGVQPTTPPEKVTVSFVVTVPAETGDSEVYLISNLDDWQEANAHLLTKDATTGNYKLELELEVGSTFEYKYVLNKLWANVEVQANGLDLAGNRKLTIAADQAPVADTVARWKGVEPEVQKVNVTLLLNVPEETVGSVFVAHNYKNNFDLTKAISLTVNDQGKHAITVELPIGFELEFKFVLLAAGDELTWANVEVQANNQDLEGNRKLTIAADMDPVELTVAKWKDIEPIVQKVNVTLLLNVPDETVGSVFVAHNYENNFDLTKAVKLITNEEGKHTITVELPIGFELEFKFVLLAAGEELTWANVEVQANGDDLEGNRKLTIAADMDPVELTVAKWKGIDPEPVDVTVNFEVTAPAGTTKDIYLVSNTVDWNTENGKKLTYNETTEKYELQLTIKEGVVFEYKYVLDKTWDLVENDAEGKDIANRKITIAAEMEPIQDVVASWNVVVLVRFEVTVPAETGDGQVYLVGSMNDWSTTAPKQLIKNVSTGKYEAELTLSVNETYYYKYTLGLPWANVEVQANGDNLVDDRTLTVDAMPPLITDTVERWKGIEPAGPPVIVTVNFVVTVPAETGDNGVYLISDMDEWQEANAHKLTKNTTTGKYELELELVAGSTFKYKYVLNKLWANVEVQADGLDLPDNRELIVAAEQAPVADTVARWQGVDPEAADVTVNFEVTAPAGTTKDIYLVSNTVDWNTENGKKLTYNETTEKYELQLTIKEGVVFEYKYVLDKTWDLVENDAEGKDIANRKITIAAEMEPIQDVVASWNVVVLVRFEVTVPAETGDGQVYLVGSMNDWSTTAPKQLIKNVSTGKYEAELTLSVNETYYYKYTLGLPWANVEVQANGDNLVDDRTLTVDAMPPLITDTVERWKDVAPAAEQVSVTFSVTLPETTPAGVDIYIIGQFPGLVPPESGNPPTLPTHYWNNFSENYKMTKGADNKYTVTITGDKNYYARYLYFYVDESEQKIEELGLGEVYSIRDHTFTETKTVNDEVTGWNVKENVDITFSLSVPVGTPGDATIYVIGVFPELVYPGDGVEPTLPIHQWNNFTEDYKMTKQADGKYTLTKTITKYIKELYQIKYKYVYTVDGIHHYWEVDRTENLDGNRQHMVNKPQTLNDSVTTWIEPAEDIVVTFSVTVPDNTPADVNIYMIGVFPGLTDPQGDPTLPTHYWNNFTEDYKMIKGEGNVYTLAISASANYILRYKYVMEVAAEEYVWEDRDNREYKVTETTTQNEQVVTWKPIPKIVKLSVTAPAGTKKVFIVVNFDEWNAEEAAELTYNTTTEKFELVAPLPEGITIEYKYLSGQHWLFEELNNDGNPIANRKLEVNESTPEQIDDTVVKWKNVYDPEGEETSVKFSVEVPEGTTGDVYLVGIVDWDPTNAIKLTKQANGKYEADVTLKLGNVYQYKYLNGQDWANVEVFTGGGERPNRALVPQSDQTTQSDVVEAWK